METTKENIKDTETYHLAEGEEFYRVSNNCANCRACNLCNLEPDENNFIKGDDCVAEIYKAIRIEDIFNENKFTPEEINKIAREYSTLKNT